jgi:two-component system, NarL family, nitrate/nitrite response regulator NarL
MRTPAGSTPVGPPAGARPPTSRQASIDQIKLFKERYPTGRITVLADRCQSNDVMSAYRAGANAFLVKVAACNVLIKSLELVMLGETIVPPAILSAIPTSDDRLQANARADTSSSEKTDELMRGESFFMPKLSAREKCISRCLLDGDANKVIARKVDIAKATVKVHVKAILRKIRVQNRTQAAIWAMNSRVFASETDKGSALSRRNGFGRGILNGNRSPPARGEG